MIKILILIAIIALMTLLGAMLSASKKKKMQVFSELYEFNEQLILNIKFNRSPVSKVAEPFKFIPEILQGKKVLGTADDNVISDYVVNLGKSDAVSQVDYLNGRKAALEKLNDDSAADYKKYSALYVKIFFMVGVLIAVLLT